MNLMQQAAFGADTLGLLGHAVCLYDGEFQIKGWSSRLHKLGIPSTQAEGRPLFDVILPLLRSSKKEQEIRDAAAGALSGKSPRVVREVELSFPGRRDLVFHLCFTPTVSETGTAAVIFEDVTEALRTREWFEHILDSTPDGIFVIDRERRVRHFNRASGFITGRNPEDILTLGCECSEVINCHNEGGESLATGSLCPAKSIFSGDYVTQREEMLLTNAEGTERWVETTYSPIRNDDGEVEFVVSILRDVHDRKTLEERLHQSEKLASLGQLVAGIAHEIKNPLAIMLSSLDVLENPNRPEEQRKDASDFMREEIKRLDERLRSFLAFARPRAIQPRPLVISGTIKRQAVTMEAFFPDIHFQIDMARPEPIIMADEEHLNQVLTNLVLNAGQAMDGKGTITIRVRQQGDMALIEVEDEGPGISEEHLSRVFDPFFTTRSNGTGLGLSICYQIVLAHRGMISVSKGKNGKGTCFGVRLPMATAFESRENVSDTG